MVAPAPPTLQPPAPVLLWIGSEAPGLPAGAPALKQFCIPCSFLFKSSRLLAAASGKHRSVGDVASEEPERQSVEVLMGPREETVGAFRRY